MAAKKPAKGAKAKKTRSVAVKKAGPALAVLRGAAKGLVKKVASGIVKSKVPPPKKTPPALVKKAQPLPGKAKPEVKSAPKPLVKAPAVAPKAAKVSPPLKAQKKEAKVTPPVAPAKAISEEPKAAALKPKTAAKGKELLAEIRQPKGLKVIKSKSKSSRGDEFTLANGKRRCREPGCDLEGFLGGYCRLHYIKNWKKVKRKELILASGQLNNYVEELVNKYPDRYLEVIRQDLSSEKDWSKVVEDLELDSSIDDAAAGDEDLEGAPESPRRVPGAEREFEDDGDSF
jgi:hypothetical protein